MIHLNGKFRDFCCKFLRSREEGGITFKQLRWKQNCNSRELLVSRLVGS